MFVAGVLGCMFPIRRSSDLVVVIVVVVFFFFFKQKTAYEMCGRDWSSDVCSSDLSEIIKVKTC